MKILYSFNKRGFEADFWTKEIAAASDEFCEFIPFNHDGFVDIQRYVRAQLLDNLYFVKHPDLIRLYAALEASIRAHAPDVLLVDNCSPYHPEYLRGLKMFKVLRTSDGPLAAYDRDFAYVHAFDQVLFHSPAYSPELDIRQKLAYVGARNVDFWPMALFDAQFEPTLSEDEVFSHERDIDVIFVGALHVSKMPTIAAVKKAFGRRCRLYGLASWKKNAYFNVRFGPTGWVRPIEADAYVQHYRRAKIGFNVHNRGKYTVGGYRLFELPGNGVMQISDGGEYLSEFFEVGREIESYERADELVEKIRFYLAHPAERMAIARQGYRRALRDHRIGDRLRQGARLIAGGMERAGRRSG